MPTLQKQFFLLTLCICLLNQAANAQDWQWTTEGRIVAVSDIHGALDAFKSVLKGTQLVDDSGHWSGKQDHLVIVGDVLDRGAASRDVMILIRQLETEANQAGGKVHLLLGNHEIMNLVGDLRYVAEDEYARYAEVEDPADRSKALKRFNKLPSNKKLGTAAIREKFNETHPPGFFGHSKLFSSQGEFGQWLLTRPVMIKINDNIFAHGGLSQSMSGKSLEEINRHHEEVLRKYVTSREYFVAKGILAASTEFYDQPHLIKRTLEGKSRKVAKEDLKNANRLIDAHRSDIFDNDSPTWYRGNVGCGSAIEQGRLRGLLHALGAQRLVIGHTPTPTRTIESRFGGMLLKVDTGMLKSRYRGQASAAIITGDQVSAFYAEQDTDDAVTDQTLRLGPWSGGLPDEELEETLARAAISNSEQGKDKVTRLTIHYEDHPIDALFSPVKSSKDGAQNSPDVAAYRLDRYLGIEMIPVAMQRNIEGVSGAVTLNLTNLIDENQRIARQLGESAWCPLKDQFNMMYMIDTLLHNKGRATNAMRYLTNNMRLILTENGKTLGSQSKIPGYLKSKSVSIPDNLKLQLQQMTAESLEELLGDVLDEKRRMAILSRRDLLLKRSN